MKHDGLTESPPGRWTRAEDYVSALARSRTIRRGRRLRGRTEPENPQLLLSTVPFLGLFALLGVLAVGIMVAAFPGRQPPPPSPQVAVKEQGLAPKGWFQEAQKDFHRQL